MISSQVFQLPPSVLWLPKIKLSCTAYAGFWHLDVLGFLLTFGCDDGVSWTSGKVTSAQSRTCFAAEPFSAVAFQATLTEVQGQHGICSRTQSPWFNWDYIPYPASLWLPVLYSKLRKDTLLLRKGLDVAKQRNYKGISHVQASILTCINRVWHCLTQWLAFHFCFSSAFFFGEGGGMEN